MNTHTLHFFPPLKSGKNRKLIRHWELFPIMDKFTMTHLTVNVYNALFNISIHLAYRKVFFLLFLFNSNNKKYCKMLKTEEKFAKTSLFL